MAYLPVVSGKPAGQQKTTQLGYISIQFNSVTTQLGVRSIQLQITWVSTQFKAIFIKHNLKLTLEECIFGLCHKQMEKLYKNGTKICVHDL